MKSVHSAKRLRLWNDVTLIHLDVHVDVADEFQSGEEGDGAKHEEEDVAGQHGVAEEFHRLQHAGHVRALEVVEQ